MSNQSIPHLCPILKAINTRLTKLRRIIDQQDLLLYQQRRHPKIERDALEMLDVLCFEARQEVDHMREIFEGGNFFSR